MTQYSSVINNTSNFKENNFWRELKILLEENKELKNSKNNLDNVINTLTSKEEIILNLKKEIKLVKVLSGQFVSESSSKLTVMLEGDVSEKDMLDIFNIIWESWADNLSVNGILMAKSGISKIGDNIVIEGVLVNKPYLLIIYHNIDNLSLVLEKKLKKYTNISISISN